MSTMLKRVPVSLCSQEYSSPIVTKTNPDSIHSMSQIITMTSAFLSTNTSRSSITDGVKTVLEELVTIHTRIQSQIFSTILVLMSVGLTEFGIKIFVPVHNRANAALIVHSIIHTPLS